MMSTATICRGYPGNTFCSLPCPWGARIFQAYHQLPTEPWSSMDYIFNILIEACVQYKTKHHLLPVIFIDGCDALAKTGPEVFNNIFG